MILSILFLVFIWGMPLVLGYLLAIAIHELVLLTFEAKAYRKALERINS